MTHTTFSAHLTRSARQIFNVLFAFAALACAAPAAQAQNIWAQNMAFDRQQAEGLRLGGDDDEEEDHEGRHLEPARSWPPVTAA